MVSNNTYKTHNLLIIILEIFILFILIGLMFKMNQLNKLQYNFSQDRFAMIQTADQLRQSSDDLTHFARTYVITNNPLYKEQYYKTLAIRNGKIQRPYMYESIYWDLDEKIRKKRHPNKEAISLMELFKKLPYSKEELKQLTLSQKNSNDLVNLETEAFKAMEDVTKISDNLIKKPNQLHAIKLMHSKEYYEAKHKIMNPIDNFIMMLNTRTKKEIDAITAKNEMLHTLFSFCVFIFIVLNIFIYQFLSSKGKEEQKKKQEQEAIIIEQSKMNSMGDMMENIAHQWRQPLSIISTCASGIQLKKECGTLEENDLLKYMAKILKATNYLSKTIDTFRSFIKEEDKIKELVIQDKIDTVLNILQASLQNNFIKVIKNINYDNPIKITLLEAELSQVLINIITNAKEILIKNHIEDKWIKISLLQENKTALITIEDNGGGIPESILSNVFDPYFTTKHPSQGTGLALYLSQRIVTGSLKGKIYVKNTQNGAKFFIELPLK